MHPTKLKVLFIAGWGRSGSTLLDNILGQLEHFVSVGELRYVWDRGLQQSQRCGCGAPFKDCPFWNGVLRDAFGGFDATPSAEMLAIREKYDHARALLLRSSMQGDEIRHYQTNLAKLYQAVAAVSGAGVVVDSSKTPSHGRILQGCADLDVYIVHLVRDSRAVAYSWQRKKSTTDGDYMTRFGAVHSSLLWDGMNVAAEMLETSDGDHYLRLRYEDLITAPRTTLHKVSNFVGASTARFPLLQDNKILLEPVHGFSGNPSRFERGAVELRPDDEWKTRLGAAKWLVITSLTGPLLRRYGYPLLSSEPQRRALGLTASDGRGVREGIV